MTDLFSKQWFTKHQKLLLWFANTWLGRKILCIDGDKSSVGNNRKIVWILPNSITWMEKRTKKKITVSTEFRTHDKFSKRLYYAFKPLWYLFHFWDMNLANPFVPAWNLGFDTLTVYPSAGSVSPVDGYVTRHGVDQTISAIVAGAGTAATDTDVSILLQASATSNQFLQLARTIVCFDTSPLTSLATITSAVLSFYVSSTTTGLGSVGFSFVIVGATPAATNTLVNSDYGQLGTTFFDFKNHGDVTVGGYNDFTLNTSGLANINKTAISKFGVVNGWDYNIVFNGSWVSGASSTYIFNSGDSALNKPKLVVTYSLPSGFFTFF